LTTVAAGRRTTKKGEIMMAEREVEAAPPSPQATERLVVH
jgi:hypothetical protein